MHAMVMLFAFNALKHDLFSICPVIPIVIIKIPYIRALCNNDTLPQYGNAQWRIEFRALVEKLCCVDACVTIPVFQDHDAVALGRRWIAIEVGAIIVRFRHPNPSPFIHINVGWILQHRFSGHQLHL